MYHQETAFDLSPEDSTMNIEIGFTDELTNTHFAPLAALSAHYQQHNRLDPSSQVQFRCENAILNLTESLSRFC